jgi:hypothetical protein
MIPTKCPVSRAFTSYISLYINNISINNSMESTSYFPSSKYYSKNINNDLEIQSLGLTTDLTPYGKNETSTLVDPTPNARSIHFSPHSRTLDSGLGI